MLNIALIGCGKIGSRHLQSIIKLNNKTNIYLVDPRNESINVCLNLVENELKQNSETSIKSCSEIKEIPIDIDFAIIASDSKPRFEIFKNLLEKRAPKYLILEKLSSPSICKLELLCKSIFVMDEPANPQMPVIRILIIREFLFLLKTACKYRCKAQVHM